MPIDTSIIGRIQPVEIKQRDPYEQFAKGMQLKQLMTQQKQQDAAIADEAAQREAFKTAGGDQAKYMQALLSTGNVKAYQAAQAQDEARKKAAAELEGIGAKTAGQNATTAKTQQDTRFEAAKQHAQEIGMVQSPQDVQAYIDSGIQRGVFPAEARDQMMQKAASFPSLDAWKQAQTQAAIPVLDRYKREAEDARAQLSADTSRRGQDIGATTARRGQDIGASTTIRGQNMTDARSRDANAIKGDEKKATQDLTKASQIASFDTMLGTLDRLGQHPGLSRSVGVMGALPTMPGSDSANFQAELNTFQSQAFIPMVAQLKGMGALSDAEGKKLTQAVGALDTKMGEKAFRESVGRIKADMEKAYSRVAGKPRAGAEGSWGEGTTKAGANVSNW